MTKGLKNQNVKNGGGNSRFQARPCRAAPNDGLLSGKPPYKTPDFETALPASRTPWAIAPAACARQGRGPCKANSQMTRYRPPCPGVKAQVNCTAPGHAQKPGNVLKAKKTIHRAECPDPISKIDSDTYNPLLSWKSIWILLQNAILFIDRVRRGANIMPKPFWIE